MICKYYHRKQRNVIYRSPKKFDRIYTWKWISETSTLVTPCKEVVHHDISSPCCFQKICILILYQKTFIHSFIFHSVNPYKVIDNLQDIEHVGRFFLHLYVKRSDFIMINAGQDSNIAVI